MNDKLGSLIKDQEDLKKFRELTKIFKYAVEHTDDYSDFYRYMSEITYGKGKVKKYLG